MFPEAFPLPVYLSSALSERERERQKEREIVSIGVVNGQRIYPISLTLKSRVLSAPLG